MRTPRAPRYNPAFLAEADLVNGFVVRKEDLDWVIEAIRENRAGSNQHLLIIGPRGMGKTMLVRRAAAVVRNDVELSKQWFPIVFGEEAYEVSTAAELWLESIFYLGRHTGDPSHQRTYEKLKPERDEKRLYDRALGHLMDFAEREKKRLVVVVENLNMVLGEQLRPDDAWVLRQTLQTEPRIMLLATSPTRFDDVTQPDRAMYELFRTHDLQALGLDECRHLWESLTGQHLPGLSIRPIQILTGGNPRLIAILGSFAERNSLRHLMEDLNALVDEHTAYFKTNLEVLPPPERKIFAVLADIWKPAGAREVAEAARFDINHASSYLNRLVQRGAVEVVGQTGRARKYQVAERLYNIYHLMRRSGEPAEQVRHVVEFMIGFYQPERLVDVVKHIVEEACGLDSLTRKDHFLVFEGLLGRIEDPDLLGKLIEASGPLLDLPDAPAGLREKSAEKLSTAALKKGIATLERRVKRRPADAEAWLALGMYLAAVPERRNEAAAAFKQVLANEAASTESVVAAGLTYGRLLFERGEFVQVENVLRQVLVRGDMNESTRGAVLVILAKVLLHFPERLDDAWDVYEAVPPGALENKSIASQYDKGKAEVLLWQRGAAALDEYSALKEKYPNDPDVWRGWILLLMASGRMKEAADAAKHLLSLVPDDQSASIVLFIEKLKNDHPEGVAPGDVVRTVDASEGNAQIELVGSIWLISRKAWDELPSAERWSKHAYSMLARQWPTSLVRMTVLLAQGRNGEAVELLRETPRYGLSPPIRSFANNVLLWLAAIGQAEAVRRALADGPLGQACWAIRVALDREVGIEAEVPREVDEIAKDVAERLATYRSGIAAGKKIFFEIDWFGAAAIDGFSFPSQPMPV